MAGKLGSALAWPQASIGDLGALGEKRATLAESEHWGWARWTDGRTDTVSSLLRLRGCLAAAGASPGCAERLSPACPGASPAVGGCWGCPGQGPPHAGWTRSCLSQVPPSDRMTPFPNPLRGLARRGRRGGRRCWASPSMSRRSWVSTGGKGGFLGSGLVAQAPFALARCICLGIIPGSSLPPPRSQEQPGSQGTPRG